MSTDALIEEAYRLYRLGQREESLLAAERAVLLAPTDPAALNTRGMILDDLGRHTEALADFDKILSIDPDHADGLTNRGIAHARRGEFQQALACYDRSLSIKPEQINVVYNRAVIRLVLGDWVRGFREFESRWRIFPHEATRLTRLAPPWTGQADIRGRIVLIHHEQGYGDSLHFVRYVPLVARLGAKVILAAPVALRKLMQTLPGSPQVLSEGDPIPRHDYHSPLMSLPLAFGTTPQTVPADVPYLCADLDRVRAWSARLGTRARPTIGLVWSGRRYPPINYPRDMTLEAVRPLFALDADFICLHTELSDEERSQLAAWRTVVWLGKDLGDFADTAALVENLDLLITVDTAMAHLAGALGKPVWLMNRYDTCWRWLLHRTDSPWYPNMRLFRQPTLGNWAAVVEDVLAAARAFIADPTSITHGARAENAADPPKRPTATIPAEKDLFALLQKALDFHNQGQWADAELVYRQVLTRQPRQAEALHYLGVVLAQQGEFRAALAPLSQALAIQPHNAHLHNHYGNALTGLARYAAALASYNRALQLDPTLSAARAAKSAIERESATAQSSPYLAR
jgi:tetratricopeptide (TPR) repeat protein